MNDGEHDRHDVKGVIAQPIAPAVTALPATTTTAGVTPGSAGVIAHPIPPATTTTTTGVTPPAPEGFLSRVIDALQERARSMLSGATPVPPPDPMITSSKFSAGLSGPAVSIPHQREDLLVADLQMKWDRPSKPTEPRPDMWHWAQVVSRQHPDIADASVAVDFAKKFSVLVKRLVTQPKERGDLISVVNEGSRAGWSEYDIVQGILATALYTYEQAKTKKCFYRPVTAYQRKCYDPSVVRALTGPEAFEDEHFPAMICTLQSFLLQCMKPVEHEIGFRGINIPVGRYYKTDEHFVWPGFASTSRDRVISMKFAKRGDNTGTLFHLTLHTGRDVSSFSVFPNEKEILMPANSAFMVGTRVSDTLLLMSGFPCDLVVAAEVGRGLAPRVAASSILSYRLESIRHMDYLYEMAVGGSKYVVPDVGSAEDDRRSGISVQSLKSILPWRAGHTVADGSVHVLLGDGGSGKTTTSMWLWRTVLETASSSGRTPLFVALPQALRVRYMYGPFGPFGPTAHDLEYASLADYLVCNLVIPSGDRGLLLDCPLVIILDSLDEVGNSVADMIKDPSCGSLYELMKLSEWKRAVFVVTSRVEYLTANALSVSHVHRTPTTPWYREGFYSWQLFP